MSGARTSFRCRLPVPAQVAWDWHARPAAFERLVPPFDPVRLVDSRGTIEEGDWKTLALPPFGLRWTAVHGRCEPPRSFQDVQARGPFARFVHDHLFVPLADGTCELRDEIDWRLPFEPWSAWAKPLVARKLARAFAWRHHVVVHDLALHARLALPALGLELHGTHPALPALRALFACAGHETGGQSRSSTSATAAVHLDPSGIVRVARPGRDVVEFECGRLVHAPSDLRARGPWTALEDAAEAVLLAAAGRTPAGRLLLARSRPLSADDEAPLEPLRAGACTIASRWASPADLHRRLRGRVRLALTGPSAQVVRA